MEKYIAVNANELDPIYDNAIEIVGEMGNWECVVWTEKIRDWVNGFNDEDNGDFDPNELDGEALEEITNLFNFLIKEKIDFIFYEG